MGIKKPLFLCYFGIYLYLCKVIVRNVERMGKCKLRKGDRVYECRYRQAVLVELVSNPVMSIQHDGGHCWKWKAQVVGTDSVVDYCITEEAPQYGPRLYRENIYLPGNEQAELLLPPFDTGIMIKPAVRLAKIDEDVELLGHVFHGLQDIEAHVELSLYKDISRGTASVRKPEAVCEVHVGEQWYPYPCFDAEDFANEDRTYRNYIFRREPLTQADMQALSDFPAQNNYCRIQQEMHADMLPMVYYCGDGPTMVVATEEDNK